MTDINDFDLFGILIIQRTDDMEMKKDEIEDIRKEFFYDPDMEEFDWTRSSFYIHFHFMSFWRNSVETKRKSKSLKGSTEDFRKRYIKEIKGGKMKFYPAIIN